MQKPLHQQLFEHVAESKGDSVLQRDLVKTFSHYDVHYVYLNVRRLDALGVIERYKRPADGAISIRLKKDDCCEVRAR